MGTDSGTPEAFAVSSAVFLAGTLLFVAIGFLAIRPDRVEKLIPGPSVVGKVLVRIPTYPVGTAGMFLLVRQIWQVGIPNLMS